MQCVCVSAAVTQSFEQELVKVDVRFHYGGCLYIKLLVRFSDGILAFLLFADDVALSSYNVHDIHCVRYCQNQSRVATAHF